ncbi:hypothetical protein ACI2OX_09255 [Bacillus sp. N9]
MKNITHYAADKMRITVTFNEFPLIDGDQLKAVIVDHRKEKMLLTYRINSEDEKQFLEENMKAGMSCVADGTLIKPKETEMNTLSIMRTIFFVNRFIGCMKQFV